MLPRWCFGRRRARPPARLGILTSFGAAPRSPPVPSGPSGALHTSEAWSLMCGFARRLEARPSPATARGCRSQALRTLRCPPHQWCQVADVARCVGLLFGQAPPPPSGTAARSLYSLWASRGSRVLSFWECFGACCYKRRQSEEFFARISDPLLQTSSI